MAKKVNNLKLFRSKLRGVADKSKNFKSQLQGFNNFINTLSDVEDDTISQVVLESLGIAIPLPTQPQAVAFYEEFGDPDNELTYIDPKDWNNKQYLQYQEDVRKYRKENKFKDVKDAKQLKQIKEEVKQQDEESKAKQRFLAEFFTDLGKNLEKQTPDDLKPSGSQRLSKTISNITKGLAKIFLPSMLNMVKSGALERFNSQKNIILNELGVTDFIQDVNDPQKRLELAQSFCPTTQELDNIIQTRDGLVEFLNETQTKLTAAAESVNIVGDIADTTQTLVDIFKSVVFTLNQAAKVIPLIPGAIVSIINDIDTVRQTILFKNDGQPRIPPLRKTISNTSIPINQANFLITKIVLSLSAIDDLIAFCRPEIVSELKPLSSEVLATVAIQLAAQNTEQESEYKGFRLEIETRKYTDTVNQNRAVGKNQSGIVLVSGEWSFASDPNILLQEVKFIIDRDNLKAY